MGIGDRDYYRRRIEQESVAAQAASCGHARDVHLDLAKRYSLKLRLIEALCLDVPDSTAEAAPAQAIVQHEARVSARR